MIELTQTEPSPSAPLVANSPLPTSLPLSLAAQLKLSIAPPASIPTASTGPSIPSAPAAQLTQHEPSPPLAQLPQQPLPIVPPLLPSTSPAPPPRSRLSAASSAAAARERSSPEQLQDQDVRRAVAVPQHVWQQAIRDARQNPDECVPLSPRGSGPAAGVLAPAVSLIDIHPVPMPGLNPSLSAIGDMSPVTDSWHRTPGPTPPGVDPEDVLLTHNALFDVPTPASAGRPPHAAPQQKGWAAWQGRLSPDENSCENVPAFLGQ